MTPPDVDRRGRERFVVGTGRCGSTLVSRMLGEHRDVVTIHECFTGLDHGRRFQDDPMSGSDLADLLGAEQPVTTEVLARGYTADEIRYPFGSPGSRHRPGDPVPWLSITMLSRLDPRPDDAFDRLLGWARDRPTTAMAAHYRALFDWLTDTYGGSIWIERSGSSIDYLADLVRLFPDARVVHIHRDGRETALSLRDHPFYRVAVAILYDLFPDTSGIDDPATAEDRAIRYVLETPPPVEVVGRYWSDQVRSGFEVVPRLDAAHYLPVRFEDLLDRPGPVLERIQAFLDLPSDPTFVERAARLVTRAPSDRWSTLDADGQRRLADAVAPGMALLDRSLDDPPSGDRPR